MLHFFADLSRNFGCNRRSKKAILTVKLTDIVNLLTISAKIIVEFPRIKKFIEIRMEQFKIEKRRMGQVISI